MPVSTRYFTVTAPQGMSNIKLDSKGSATCQITVKNVSGAVIDGRAVLVSLPPATKDSPGPVERNWVKIDGTAERHYAVDREEVFSIKIAVAPQKKGEAVPAGNYGFRMDVINIARTDDSGDQSQALGFTVAAAPPPAKSKLPLILIIAAVVLIVGGVTTWLLLRPSSTSSTDTSKSTASPTPAASSTPVARSTPAPRPTPAPPANPWVGTWVNDNPNTRAVAKIAITQEGRGFSVHVWGKCGQAECDWGSRPAAEAGTVTAEFVQGTTINMVYLQLASNRLLVKLAPIIAGRPGPQSSEFFHR